MTAVFVKIGWQIDEDLAEILRIVGDVYERYVDSVLPPGPGPETARTAMAASLSPPGDVSESAPHLSSTLAFVSEHHETMENIGAAQEETDIVDLDKQPETTAMDAQMDEFRTLKSSTALIPLTSHSMVSHLLSDDDEGYG